MKVVVCGSRDFQDTSLLYNYLDKFHEKFTITHLIEGAARGADRQALAWAIERKIKFSEYPADWNNYGNAASGRRNQQMVNQKPDCVIAFYSNPSTPSHGTRDCVIRAMKAAIPVYYGSESVP